MASERRMPKRREPEAPPPGPPARRARWPLVLAVMLVVGGVLGVTFWMEDSEAITESRERGSRRHRRGDVERSERRGGDTTDEAANGRARRHERASDDPRDRPPTLGPSGEPVFAPPEELTPHEMARARVERLEHSLQNLRRYYRYPRGSRPLRESEHMLEPNYVEPELRPLDPDAERQEGEAAVEIRQSQSRLFASEGDAVVVYLEAGQGRDRVPLELAPAVLTARTEASARPVGSIELRDDGVAPDASANDLVYSGGFTADRALLGDHVGAVVAEVQATAGGETGSVTWQVLYTAGPPARVTGQVREALENGSLALYVGFEVERAGRYESFARVEDANGRVFALVSFRGDLEAGRRELRFEVFGLLVHDEDAPAPFTLRDVEAWRMRLGEWPDRELVPLWPGPYQTRAYARTDFSDAELESEEKDQRLEAREAQVAEARESLETTP